MFRLAKELAAKNDVQQWNAIVTEPVFVSDYRFLWAAVALYGAAFLVTTLPLWAFWELGRTVTMSPVEVAHAFDAQIFKTEGTNLTAEQLMDSVGRRKVQYGVLRSHDEMNALMGSGALDSGRLVFGDTDGSVVDRPYKGQVFYL